MKNEEDNNNGSINNNNVKEDFSNQPDIKESNEPMTINEIKNFKHIEPMSKKEI